MKNVLTLVLIAMMMIAIPLTAGEKKGQKFEVNMKDKGMFVMLTTQKPAKAGLATALATKTLIRGGKATIVLSGKALHLGLKEGKLKNFGPKGVTVREMLKKFMKKGGRVIVCAMCAKNMGVTKKDFVKGIELKMSDRVLEQMYQKNWKVLSF